MFPRLFLYMTLTMYAFTDHKTVTCIFFASLKSVFVKRNDNKECETIGPRAEKTAASVSDRRCDEAEYPSWHNVEISPIFIVITRELVSCS